MCHGGWFPGQLVCGIQSRLCLDLLLSSFLGNQAKPLAACSFENDLFLRGRVPSWNCLWGLQSCCSCFWGKGFCWPGFKLCSPRYTKPLGLIHTEVGGRVLRCDGCCQPGVWDLTLTRLLIKSEKPCVHSDLFVFFFSVPGCHGLCQHESMCLQWESPASPVTARLAATCGSWCLRRCRSFLGLFFSIEVELIYSVVLVSGVQQCDSVVYILFQILFHCRLLQGIEYSSLCYVVGPCCLSILYIVLALF